MDGFLLSLQVVVVLDLQELKLMLVELLILLHLLQQHQSFTKTSLLQIVEEEYLSGLEDKEMTEQPI